MHVYVKSFLRRMFDALFMALCIIAGAYLFFVLYTVFSCFIH